MLGYGTALEFEAKIPHFVLVLAFPESAVVVVGSGLQATKSVRAAAERKISGPSVLVQTRIPCLRS